MHPSNALQAHREAICAEVRNFVEFLASHE